MQFNQAMFNQRMFKRLPVLFVLMLSMAAQADESAENLENVSKTCIRQPILCKTIGDSGHLRSNDGKEFCLYRCDRALFRFRASL